MVVAILILIFDLKQDTGLPFLHDYALCFVVLYPVDPLIYIAAFQSFLLDA